MRKINLHGLDLEETFHRRSSVCLSKREYLRPAIQSYFLSQQTSVLAGSPIVEPGPSVEPPKDGGEEELWGAKSANLWFGPTGEESNAWEE